MLYNAYILLPGEIKELKSRLKAIEKKVTSMVDAIMDGVYSPTMKEKLSEAELEKEDLINRISFYEHCNQIGNAPDKNFITEIIANDRGIKK